MNRTVLGILILVFAMIGIAGWAVVTYVPEPMASADGLREEWPKLGAAPESLEPLSVSYGYAVGVTEDGDRYQLRSVEIAERPLAEQSPDLISRMPAWPLDSAPVSAGSVVVVGLVVRESETVGVPEHWVLRDLITGSVLDEATPADLGDGYGLIRFYFNALHRFQGRLEMMDQAGGVTALGFPPVDGHILPENRGIENLYQVKVPFLRLDTPLHAVNFLEGATQQRFSSRVDLFPYSYQSVTYEEVTVREVFQDLLLHKGAERVWPNPKTHRIERAPTLMEQFRGWF